MGTVAEKLTYLNDTRLKIKDGLNKFGADLTENDTFRSYSNVLNDIYDKLPKVSGNGSNFTLKNAQNGKLDLFEMEGNTEQTTYTGKNLNVYPYNGYTVSNGMTFSANTDGTVLINGQNNNNGNSAFYFFRNAEFIIPAGTTYYIIPPSNTSIMYTMYDGSHYYEFTSNNNYSITFNEQTTITLFYVQIRKGNTTVFTNEKVYPMLSTIPVTTNDYEPYVGGTASPNPDFPQDIKVVTGEQTINIVGKNLFDNVTTKQLILSDGTINNNNSWNLGDYVKVQPNTQYTFSRFDGTGQSLIIGEYDKNKNFIQRDVQGSMTADTPYIITTTATTNYLRLNYDNTKGNTKLQLETGSTATSYEPYHNQDYEIDLGDIELCEIGDYKDVIFKNNQLSGYYDSTLDEDGWYIKKEIGKVILDGSEVNWDNNFGINLFAINRYFNNKPFIVGYGLSNYYKYNSVQSGIDTNTQNGDFALQKYNDQYNLFIKNTNYNNVSDFKTWLSTHNTEIYYPLETPTYEEITNSTLISQLKAIETETGTNIFEVRNDNDVLPSLNVKRLKELEKLS